MDRLKYAISITDEPVGVNTPVMLHGTFGKCFRAAADCGVGVPTLRDVAAELMKPGRDIRDELPKPILRTDVLEMKDLKPGMVLTGTVRNVHQDGLVHISQLREGRRVQHPSEVCAVGDIVTVWVLEVDEKKKRISLTMKKPKG